MIEPGSELTVSTDLVDCPADESEKLGALTAKAFEIISGVKEIKEITQRDYQRCKTALETKARNKAKP